jgi:quinol monooxygenase YgiN
VSVVVVATIYPQPEHRAEVTEAFVKAVGQVHDEDGCELYTLNEGADRLIMVEKWASPEALKQHDKSQALADLGAALAGKLVSAPEILVLQPHPAGDPDKGIL